MMSVFGRRAVAVMSRVIHRTVSKPAAAARFTNSTCIRASSQQPFPTITAARHAHSQADVQGDKELLQYLGEEIKLEAENLQGVAAKVGDFDVNIDGALVTFTKQDGNERTKVKFNVNNSVDAALGEEMAEGDDDADQAPPMLSKPPFEVEIQKGSKTLLFACSMLADEDMMGGQDQDQEKQQQSKNEEPYPEDIFNIEEVTIYEGTEASRSTYSMAGDVMDGEMYDRLMDYLSDRGVDSDFCQQLVSFSTAHEGQLYVGLLKDLQAFVAA